jgi:hypothetical protein
MKEKQIVIGEYENEIDAEIKDKEKIPTKERSSFSLNRQRKTHANRTVNH